MANRNNKRQVKGLYIESLRGGSDLPGVAAAGLYWRLTAALEPVARQVRIVVKATAVFLLDAIINLLLSITLITITINQSSRSKT